MTGADGDTGLPPLVLTAVGVVPAWNYGNCAGTSEARLERVTDLNHQWSEASADNASLRVVDVRLILQRDGDSTNAQLVALAPATGKTLWESPRPLDGASYSTPMVWRHDGLEELMVQGRGRVAAYSLDGGPPKWWVRGWGFEAVTTPVAGEGMLLVGGGFMGDPSEPRDPVLFWSNLIAYDANKDGQLSIEEIPAELSCHMHKEMPKETPGNNLSIRDLLRFVDQNHDRLVDKAEWDASEAASRDNFKADRFVAIRPGGKNDSTETHVAWETTKGLSQMPSPHWYEGPLYFIRDGGLLTIIEPKSGQRVLDRQRLVVNGQFVASPIAANGYVYVVNETGTFAVLGAGDTPEVVAVNKLGESVRSTTALVDNTISVRSAHHLWAFGAHRPVDR